MGTSPSFIQFATKEIRKFFRIFILYSLLPFLQIQKKFKLQSSDSINRNNLVFYAFSQNSELRLKEFKRYFIVAELEVKPLSNEECPN